MRRRRPARGATLVEMIVAVTLLGTGIAACVACVASATRVSGVAEEYTAVQLLAREKLAELELAGAPPGLDEGDFGPERPGYGWRTVTEPVQGGLSRVRLTLVWGRPESPKEVEFVTFVRGTPALPGQ